MDFMVWGGPKAQGFSSPGWLFRIYEPSGRPQGFSIHRIIVPEMFPTVNSTAIETRVRTLRFFRGITNSTGTPTPSRGVNLFPPNFAEMRSFNMAPQLTWILSATTRMVGKKQKKYSYKVGGLLPARTDIKGQGDVTLLLGVTSPFRTGSGAHLLPHVALVVWNPCVESFQKKYSRNPCLL